MGKSFSKPFTNRFGTTEENKGLMTGQTDTQKFFTEVTKIPITLAQTLQGSGPSQEYQPIPSDPQTDSSEKHSLDDLTSTSTPSTPS